MLTPAHVRSIALAARSTTAVLGAAILTGCADAPTATQLSPRELSPFRNVGAQPRTPKHYPNAIKYRDAGHRPATGRSGSASLMVRALIGKDHATELEVTTGALDDGSAAPGNIDKLQLKILNMAGEHMSTRNYSGLRGGGYVSHLLANLVRGSGVQIQANVGGIDGNRTDVVTVTETVRWRPDVAVTGITAPASALVDVPVEIVAEVKELNGDVGARTDCVLSVNDAPVGLASGIWVDAAGVVSCAFGLRFPTAGRMRLTVALTGVVPGDYDDGNNVREAELVVEESVTGFFFAVGAGEATERSSWRVHQEYTYGPDQQGVTSSFRQSEVTSAFEFPNQFSWLVSSLPRELPFPFAGIKVFHFTNGGTLFTRSYDLTADIVQEDATVRMSCAYRRELTDNNVGVVIAQLCSGVNKGADGLEYPFTRFDHYRNTSEITYYVSAVEGEFHVQYPDGTRTDQTWSNNYFTDQPRSVPAFGSDYRIRMELVSGGNLYVNDGRFEFTSYRTEYPDQPWTCTPWMDGFYRGTTCLEVMNKSITGTFGSFQGWGTVESIVEMASRANDASGGS